MHSILMWMMKVLLIFWRLFHIFIILLNRCDLCVEMTWTSAMHFLYFFHHCFHWLLWYCAIAMLSLVKIVAAKVNCLHLLELSYSKASFSWWWESERWCNWHSSNEHVSVCIFVWFSAYNHWFNCITWSCLAACSDEHAVSLCTFLLSKSWCLLFWMSL